LQQIHRQYQEQFKETHQEKERSTLRKQLYQHLEDAETSFKLLLKNPEMMTMTPEQLQQALSNKPTPVPKTEKKGLMAKLLTPKNSPDKPRTRYQIRQQKKDEDTKTTKK
jgi:hypothetical protein